MILRHVVSGDANFHWQDLAACRGMAEKRKPNGEVVDYFFDTYETDEESRDAVKALCASCPVRQNCLIYGLENKLSGVWGGEYLEDGTIK